MKGAAHEKQEVLGQWPGINTQFTYAGQRLDEGPSTGLIMLYISVTCRGPATASRCWAKVNTELAKHTPLLTSLPWLSLGQAPVSSTIKCSQLRSSSDTTPRKYVGNINKPLQIVSICNSKTIAYNVQHPLNEREHIKFCQMLVYLSLKEQI